MTIGLAALIAAALLDVYTTYRGVKLPSVTEANPVARALLGSKPKILPMLLGKAAAIGLLVWMDAGQVAYFVCAAIWGAASLHNLKIIRRLEDANG